MAATLFCAAAVLLLAISAHPFVTYPLSLRLVRWARGGAKAIGSAGRAGTYEPKEVPLSRRFAVCMCAYNEESVIAKKIENLLELRRRLGGLHILVYIDCASDRTAEIASEFADEIRLVVAKERLGKSHGMNQLLAEVTAPVVVFTDANVEIEPDALVHLGRYFDDPQIGCVCGHLIYVNGEESATAATGSLYWRFEEGIKQLESDTGSVMGADGSIFAIRRQLHRATPPDIIDDMFVSINILCDGYRIVRAPNVRAYERSVVGSTDEVWRKVRIGCQSFNVHRALRRRLKQVHGLDRYKYLSHKLMRWFTAYTLGASAICGTAALALAYGPVAAGALVPAAGLLVLGQRLRIPVLTHAVDIVGAFVATGAGVWLSLRGERFQTWTPMASARVGGQGRP